MVVLIVSLLACPQPLPYPALNHTCYVQCVLQNKQEGGRRDIAPTPRTPRSKLTQAQRHYHTRTTCGGRTHAGESHPTRATGGRTLTWGAGGGWAGPHKGFLPVTLIATLLACPKLITYPTFIHTMLSERYNAGRGKQDPAPTPRLPKRPQNKSCGKVAPGVNASTRDTPEAGCDGNAGGMIGRGPTPRGGALGEGGEPHERKGTEGHARTPNTPTGSLARNLT